MGRGKVTTSGEVKTNVWVKLDQEEQLNNHRGLDWTHAPGVHRHRYDMVGTDWFSHPVKPYLEPMVQRRGRKLRVVSFGSGNGSSDEQAFKAGWPAESWTCCEYATSLLPSILTRIKPYCANAKAIQFDFDDPNGLETNHYDVAFFAGSIHHCRNLETFLPFLNSVLVDDGLIIGADYFGPPRFQTSYETKKVIEEIWACLPPRLRYNRVTRRTEDVFQNLSWEGVVGYDPSEAPRSADLRDLFFSNFRPLEYKPQGGTLLRPLLSMRAGNFTEEQDLAIMKLLIFIEKTLINNGTLRSDDIYFVCEKSRSIGAHRIENIGVMKSAATPE